MIIFAPKLRSTILPDWTNRTNFWTNRKNFALGFCNFVKSISDYV